MENNNVVKKALAEALAKAGHKDVKDFLKTKGVETPSEKTEKVEKPSARKEENYCNGDCQKGIVSNKPAPVPEAEVLRSTPIWPLPEGQTIEQFRAELAAERARMAKEREAFLKQIDSPENLAKVAEAGRQAAARLPSRHISEPTRKQEEKTEKAAAKKAKAAEPKKESGRQNRLGQTKLIDELIKSGKTEKEIFDTVRTKIPTYPADKLPKLIKLRQYHVKK